MHSMNPASITVTRTNTFNGYGRLSPFSWTYAATGPDGRRFTNASVVEITRVIKSRYEKGTVKVVQEWDGKVR